MQYSSVNHLSLVPPFVSSDAHLLWKLMIKGEKLKQRYENTSWGEVEVGHGHGQRGSNFEEWRRIEILGQE